MELGFDIAGVQESKDGPVVGFVVREELQQGNISAHLKPFSAADLISDSTTLTDLLSFLRKRERAFILLGPSVTGIVTRADLNKPPVRIYLFGIISLLEMHLQYWVNEAYPNESWRSVLTAGRLGEANKFQEERKVLGEDLALIDCIQFCDKSSLLTKKADLIANLKLVSKTKAEELFKRAQDLRNLLAHSQSDLAQSTSWEARIALIEKIVNVIQRSDELVGQRTQPRNESQNDLSVVGQG
jgi:hypothetical protein